MVSRSTFAKAKPAKSRGRTVPSSRWTKNDALVLRKLAGTEPVWRIAQILGRSELSVRWKAKKDDISLSWKAEKTTTQSKSK